MAFSEAQLKSLEAKLDSKYVRTRRAHDITLAYVEGWHVIAEANRIFGYDAWDRHTLSTRCVWSGSTNHHYAAAYIAKVRIAVRAGSLTITREGCGSGEAKAPHQGKRMNSRSKLRKPMLPNERSQPLAIPSALRSTIVNSTALKTGRR